MIDPKEIKRLRVTTNFNYKYAEQGGIDTLVEMAERYETVKTMADHFGLTVSRTIQVLEVILGMGYSQYLREHDIKRAGVRVAK